MKRILLILSFLILSSLMLVGCNDNLGKEDLVAMWYKGITNAKIPDKCLDYKEDVCGLFDCMVDQCWCDDSSPDLPILYETHIEITDEQGAEDAVNAYISELINGGIETEIENPKELQVIRAFKMNTVFYNVFVEDNEGNEYVYTVAVDGTIIKTICGV
ncbi:MAG: hypothetical protein KJ955_08475 [Nanoarchaeota archaeon]|nr:hypothetical protein [Nanoarchaeota archaeon]